MYGCQTVQCADAACLLIAITTPITFWSYGKMVQLWQSSGDPDLVSPSQGSKSAAASTPLQAMPAPCILSPILLESWFWEVVC